MGKKLTRKQSALARAKVKDPDATLQELGERAGYTKRQHVKRELDKPHVQDRIRDLMDKFPELRDESLLKKVREGLRAKDYRMAVARDGSVVERDYPDHAVRHKYLETALNLKHLKDQEFEGSDGNVTVHIVSYGKPKESA